MPLSARRPEGPQSITHSLLVKELVHDFPHVSERHVVKAAAVIESLLTKTLIEGDRVEVRGFGSFGVKERRARKGRNPMTNEEIDLKRRCTVFFKAGKDLRARVDASRSAGE